MTRIHPGVLAIAVLQIAACGGGGGSNIRPDTPAQRPPSQTQADPAPYLRSERFTMHQPQVLEQIGAHHAYANGLTGRGVRIGIEDTIVDYTQRDEFGNRVRLREADGASLVYWRPPGRENSYDAARCLLNPQCAAYTIDSQGDDDAYNREVEDIVGRDGWPTHDDEAYIIDDHYSESDPIGRLYRAWEIPTPYGEGFHGTAVGSTAAGQRLGVAPGAVIVPIATNLTEDQHDELLVAAELLSLVAFLPPAERTRLDQIVADEQRNEYAKFDIINRSYGPESPPDPQADALAVAEIDGFLRTNLPATRRALLQLDRPAAERTVVVYAAGNEGHERPHADAALAYYMPEVRGHHVAVVATDPGTRRIANRQVNDAYNSDRCGPLPHDWNAARHGPHFCLAAPGTVRGLVPDARTPGQGRIEEVSGTSFAAPVVSGALALMMEHFRGSRGNTEIVRRMLKTADRSGAYAQSEIYGAGHLDLEAALSPVGALTAGQEQRALAHTSLQTPGAFGSVADRLADTELATFDAQGFPFWMPVSGLVSSRGTARSPIPEASAHVAEPPAVGLEALGMHWATVENPREPDFGHLVVGFGPTSVSIAKLADASRWGYGASFADGEYLGGRGLGGFGTTLRSGMVWASRSFARELGESVTLEATATLAAGAADYEASAMFEASASLMSAAAVRVGTERTGVTVEQPLRAESGTGTFRLETGWIENGRRARVEHRVPLRPEAREVRMTLRHERGAAGGHLAIELAGALDAGHVRGERDASLGVAWRTSW